MTLCGEVGAGGFLVAAALQWLYPVSIPWAAGLTSGTVALAINALLLVGISLARPASPGERARVDALFDRVARGDHRPAGSDLAPGVARTSADEERTAS